MSKKKLIEEIKLNPARYYRLPSDVGRDRRFNNDERMDILAAWEKEVTAAAPGSGDAGAETAMLAQVKEARRALESKLLNPQVPPPDALREEAKFRPLE